MKLISKIGEAIERAGTNAHAVSMATGITYTVLWKLTHGTEPEMPPTTRIATLVQIARHLGVRVDDLFEVVED